MKCAFGPCSCTVDDRDPFCGPTCRMGIGTKKEPCKCGHGECSATEGSAARP
jgi:hypothetical protein